MAKGSFVTLADSAIFKSRYGQWYLIETCKPDSERLQVEDGGEEVLLALFGGLPIAGATKAFDLDAEELFVFLDGLVEEGVASYANRPADCRSRCYDLEPPLDCLNLLLTNVCNLRCKHCYLESGERLSGELDGKTWVRVLEEGRGLGVFKVNVSGGEPLLHPGFKEVAEYLAGTSAFSANLNTNGFVLRSECLPLIKRAFRSVQVSLDHFIPERHDRFRGREGSFARAISSIFRLREYGITVNVGFTLTRGNLDAVDGMVELCENLGAAALSIGFMAEVGRAEGLPEAVRFFDRDPFLDRLYAKILSLGHYAGPLRINLPFRWNLKGGVKRCICGGDNTQIAYILADGTVVPCDKLPAQKFACGNVKDSSLREIWLSSGMKSFKLMSPAQLPKCRDCEHLARCGGACVARGFQIGSSLDYPDLVSCALVERFAAGERSI